AAEQSTSPSTPSTTTAPRLLPPRPKDLPIKGVDPCTLLSAEQLAQLSYRSEGRPVGDQRPGEEQCSFSQPLAAPARSGSLVTLVTNEDATEHLKPERRSGTTTTDETKVAGFPSVKITKKLPLENCQIVVDVTDGQYLDVLATPLVGRGTDTETYCREAQRVAEFAIQTLLARR
ncbi:DUF3558 domain-containing protein, partial [Allokutzneria sp. NRRL B-24872]|uniref:DUF3558 domain-containing protein n=1 Tax=Allokutzneria sp. NRRL B-24872 TaxID=1137961 RepID=UPI000A374991